MVKMTMRRLQVIQRTCAYVLRDGRDFEGPSVNRKNLEAVLEWATEELQKRKRRLERLGRGQSSKSSR